MKMVNRMREEAGVGLLARRVINKLGRPFGINPFPRAFSNPLLEAGASSGQVFERIFTTNFWDSQESYSGRGSEKAFTKPYCDELQNIIAARGFVSLFDAPCGDLNWIPQVIAATGIRYVGGDISASVVESVRRSHPNFEVKIFDICEESFPEVDVWHCRDCLFHLPFADIRQALKHFASSRIPYALLTTHKARWHSNLDVTRGGFRYLDLERDPINLPQALHYLKDYTSGVDLPRYIGLWPRDAIARAVDVFDP
jgi:hypothetical protein